MLAIVGSPLVRPSTRGPTGRLLRMRWIEYVTKKNPHPGQASVASASKDAPYARFGGTDGWETVRRLRAGAWRAGGLGGRNARGGRGVGRRHQGRRQRGGCRDRKLGGARGDVCRMPTASAAISWRSSRSAARR